MSAAVPWPEAKRYLRLAAPLAAVLVIIIVFLPLAGPADFHVFFRAGHALLHGQPVYPRLGTPAVYSGYSFVYPYLASWPFAALATLPSGVASAVFFGICAGAVMAATLAGTDGDVWSATLVLATAFTVTGLQLGSLSPLLFAGVVVLWRLRDRPVAFGLLAAPVVASKVFLAPILLWPLVAGRYRAFAWTAGATALVLGAGFLVGPLSPHQYMQMLSALSSHEALSGFGLDGALRNRGVAAGSARLITFVVAGLLFAGSYAYFRRSRDERMLFIGAILGSLVLTPVLWSHYFVLLPAAVIVLDAPRRWLAALAIASWAIAPPHNFDLDPPLLAGIATTGAWLASAGVLVFYAARARRRHRAA